ncbi:MAG: sensor histidine kinase [Acidaminococcaceae bacterium]|nr:sensor histidine kinase [Acidaminococcaceae bacterium]
MTNQLTQEQWNILDGMRSNLGLAADMAQAKISLFLPLNRSHNYFSFTAGKQANRSGDICFLSVFDQAEPLTRAENTEPEEITRAADEPLITQALIENIVMEGFHEVSTGQYARMKVYPICDTQNRCFAAAAFEDREADVVFWDTTMDFLRDSKKDNAANSCYRRLSSIDGLVLVDAGDGRILAANNAARHIYRVLGIGSLVGRCANSEEICWNGIGNVLRSGIAEEQEIQQKGLFLDFRFIPLHIGEKTERIIVVIEDITQLKHKDEELRVKAAVIREIHHRVKNNLQTIASLLRLEQRRAASEEARVVLRDSINRISSIALVHEYLSGQGTETVDINELGNGIFRTVMSSMKTPDLALDMKFIADNLRLPSQQAASLALVFNELLQNALEHGFENRKSGHLTATIRKLHVENEASKASAARLMKAAAHTAAGKTGRDILLLQVEDDGIGLSPGFNLQKSKSLGLKIVQTVVQSDLKGTFTLQSRADGNGTIAKVIIPV